jgi:hypothetical protein
MQADSRWSLWRLEVALDSVFDRFLQLAQVPALRYNATARRIVPRRGHAAGVAYFNAEGDLFHASILARRKLLDSRDRANGKIMIAA